jgi:hypothetical protein
VLDGIQVSLDPFVMPAQDEGERSANEAPERPAHLPALADPRACLRLPAGGRVGAADAGRPGRRFRPAERGLELLADAPAARRERLQGMHDFYAWLEREMPALWERWRREQQETETRGDGNG